MFLHGTQTVLTFVCLSLFSACFLSLILGNICWFRCSTFGEGCEGAIQVAKRLPCDGGVGSRSGHKFVVSGDIFPYWLASMT